MSIKDNLEKAAAIFGDSHEPRCVAMTEETKAKTIKDGKEQMREAIADMFERNEVVAKKPFDISEYQSPSMREIDQPYIDCVDSELLIVIGKVDKGWAIAIAKALGVTGEDLL